MRCAIYCRLSREDEGKSAESESIQNQKSLLIEYALKQNWDIVGLYSDEDYSGADQFRPDFCRLITDAASKTFDIILCKSQSRFTRDMELVERYIHGLFPLWGIRFVAIADHVDSNHKGNKKARQINGLINEWYLEDLSENIRMVLDHKRQQGCYIAATPLYGYRRHPNERSKLIPDPNAATVVVQIFQWAIEGKGAQHIALLLNEQGIPNPTAYKQLQGYDYAKRNSGGGLWNRSTISRMLRNEMYLGTMVQGTQKKQSYKSKKLVPIAKEHWYRVERTHEALIQDAQFQQVQALQQGQKSSKGSVEPHPLAGLIFCKDCRQALHKNAYRYKDSTRSYLRCTNKSCPARERGQKPCSSPLTPLLETIEATLHSFLKDGYEPSLLPAKDNTLSHWTQALAALEMEQERHHHAFHALYMDKVSGTLTPALFARLSQEISKELSHLEQQAERCHVQIGSLRHAREDVPPCLTPPFHRSLLLHFIQRIELSPKESGKEQPLHILWRF